LAAQANKNSELDLILSHAITISSQSVYINCKVNKKREDFRLDFILHFMTLTISSLSVIMDKQKDSYLYPLHIVPIITPSIVLVTVLATE